jgi:hypothetical protein
MANRKFAIGDGFDAHGIYYVQQQFLRDFGLVLAAWNPHVRAISIRIITNRLRRCWLEV